MLKTFHNLRLIYPRCLKKNVACLATKPVAKETPTEEQQLKEFEQISNIQRKIRIKKPQKPPFLKNVVLGKFDIDILTYPEISNEELNNLNKEVEKAQAVLKDAALSECSEFSKSFLVKLAKGGLIGLQASQLMGGKEMTATETCRILELFSELPLKNTVISNEILGIQTLVKFGSDHLKRKYLDKLIKGELVSAFCVLEKFPSVDPKAKSAVKSRDGKTWTIKGFKKFVANGSDADIYIVLANSHTILIDELRNEKFTAFVVEREFGGITSTRLKLKDGENNLSDVAFDNTTVPNENVIGIENEADKILTSLFPEYRLSVAPICLTILKKAINQTIEHFINISQPKLVLHEADSVRVKLGDILASIYAVESMMYLTSSLIDNYENQDTQLETAVLKVFSSEQAVRVTSTCLNLIGEVASVEDHWCNQLHAEASRQVLLNDTNDNMKLLIALFALQHTGIEINELVKQIRNPLFNLITIMKRAWTSRRQDRDNPKLNLFLHYNLHPACMSSAQSLEYCVLRLQYASETFLIHYGNEIMTRHTDLTRLADCIIDIYAMTACLSRASRSYCIGLQHAEYEMTLAKSFIHNTTKKIKERLVPLIDGPYMTTDENERFVSERLFNWKSYYPVHPLTRNF